MNKIQIIEYLEYRIRELERYIKTCCTNLENSILPDIEYYDREISITNEIIRELKDIIERID